MSFGFGVGDFLAVLRIAKDVYTACKDGPGEYQEICREARSLQYTLEELSQNANDSTSLLNRKVQALVEKHSRLLDEGQGLRRVWDAYEIGSSDLDDMRGKLTFHISTITLFMQSLTSAEVGRAIGRLESKVDRIYAKLLLNDSMMGEAAGQSRMSMASTASTLSLLQSNEEEAWLLLKGELLAEGVSVPQMMTYKEDIINYLKGLIEEGLPSDPDEGGVGTIYQHVDEIDKKVAAVSSSATESNSAWKFLNLGEGIGGYFRVVKVGRLGSDNNLPATIIGLDLSFRQWIVPSLATARVYITLRGGKGLQPWYGAPLIRQICPAKLEGRKFLKKSQLELRVPALPITISYSIPLKREGEHTMWQLGGFYDNSGKDHAVWNITSDVISTNDFLNTFRFGVLVTHMNQGFEALIQVKISTRSVWERMKAVGGGRQVAIVKCDSMAGEDIVTSEDLEMFVGEVNDKHKQTGMIS